MDPLLALRERALQSKNHRMAWRECLVAMAQTNLFTEFLQLISLAAHEQFPFLLRNWDHVSLVREQLLLLISQGKVKSHN
jgi:hypothetical protein